MKVTIEEFSTGGGWYLLVNGTAVAALLPSDIERIVNVIPTTIKEKQRVKDAVQAHYEQEEETR